MENEQTFINILEEELQPAFGCTEPIAIAYCASKAKEVLGCLPDTVQIEASGNIIKNVKSVIVPNTGGLKGIPAAAAAGIVAGDPCKQLEVISSVTSDLQKEIKDFLDTHSFAVLPLNSEDKLDLIVTLKKDSDTVKVRIVKTHCNIVSINKNGEELCTSQDENCCSSEKKTDRSILTVESIYQYAQAADLSKVKAILDRQISYNYAIAKEGLKNSWGANIGSVLLNTYDRNDVRILARAYAAAGSDARMSGCELPVVINAGSGNQGITCSVPVIVYAKEYECTQERLYRALLISNLIAIHIKDGIGPLSAFCGAVSAGTAAGCGIAYLLGGNLETISHTLVNSIAIESGIICDGAKPSCAAKIAEAVDAGILGYAMYTEGQQFYGEDGIVSKGAENTIANICRLGGIGMNGTDEEIIKIMTHCD